MNGHQSYLWYMIFIKSVNLLAFHHRKEKIIASLEIMIIAILIHQRCNNYITFYLNPEQLARVVVFKWSLHMLKHCRNAGCKMWRLIKILRWFFLNSLCQGASLSFLNACYAKKIKGLEQLHTQVEWIWLLISLKWAF